jgi:hypothetical protein
MNELAVLVSQNAKFVNFDRAPRRSLTDGMGPC